MGTPIDTLASAPAPLLHHHQQQQQPLSGLSGANGGHDEYARRAWPGCTQLPEWKPDAPIYSSVPLEPLLPKLSAKGIDLLRRLLEYAPEKRISAEQALLHPYFDELRNIGGNNINNNAI
ncbi:hypothetical protein GGF42_008533 [Coemansia sp. RSA 2424]|nr:hypothetical protein GGF42_008533 [Coemansia sp. RSA 2424]